MKKAYALILFCLISYASFACSCIGVFNFCDGVGETAIIALIKVTDIDASTGTATLKRIEVLQGEIPASFEINFHSLCPDSSELLELDGEALVNLGMWGDDYHLAPCKIGVLPLKNGKLQGQVTSEEADMSYTDFKAKELDCFDETKLVCNDDISIYPNPFYQSIFFANDLVEIEAIELYNIKGQLVYEKKPIASLAGHIDVPNLPTGIYIVKIISNGDQLSFKVVKGQ